MSVNSSIFFKSPDAGDISFPLSWNERFNAEIEPTWSRDNPVQGPSLERRFDAMFLSKIGEKKKWNSEGETVNNGDYLHPTGQINTFYFFQFNLRYLICFL